MVKAPVSRQPSSARYAGRLMPETNPKPPPDSRRGAVAGLIIAAVILGIGLWLAHDLTAASKMQDCVMSGRRNCNVIEPAP